MKTEMLFTQVSGNAKTGPIPVSGSLATTCPPACPFAPKAGKANGCYAAYGPISWHWAKLNGGKVGVSWNQFLSSVRKLWKGSLWRHNQFGDLAGIGNAIDGKKLVDLTVANRGKMGFTYTHKPVLTSQDKTNAASNRKAIKAANAGGFTVNLSGNNPSHADDLKALGIGPVVCVVPEGTPKTSLTPGGNRIVVCPAQYEKSEITCQRCGFCQRQDRSVIVGFWAHGIGVKYAEGIAAA